MIRFFVIFNEIYVNADYKKILGIHTSQQFRSRSDIAIADTATSRRKALLFYVAPLCGDWSAEDRH